MTSEVGYGYSGSLSSAKLDVVQNTDQSRVLITNCKYFTCVVFLQ